MDEKSVARFWAKVDRRGPADCWLWTAATDRAGYGALRVAPRVVKSHRVAFELAHGPIPRGIFVCHKCDVPACVNPDHLFLGTPADNHADMVAKGRARGARGEAHHRAKLTADDVREIRRRAAAGETQREIGSAFGVSDRSISAVVRRETWAHT